MLYQSSSKGDEESTLLRTGLSRDHERPDHESSGFRKLAINK